MLFFWFAFTVEVQLVYRHSTLNLIRNKIITQIEHNRIENPNWQEATSWIITSVAKELMFGRPKQIQQVRAGHELGINCIVSLICWLLGHVMQKWWDTNSKSKLYNEIEYKHTLDFYLCQLMIRFIWWNWYRAFVYTSVRELGICNLQGCSHILCIFSDVNLAVGDGCIWFIILSLFPL